MWFSTASASNRSHWTSRKTGNGAFDCHCPKLMTLDLKKVPIILFSTATTLNNEFVPREIPQKVFFLTATVPNRSHWTLMKSRERGFCLPAPRIIDIGRHKSPGHRERPGNWVFEYYYSQLMTVDFVKVTFMVFLIATSLNR